MAVNGYANYILDLLLPLGNMRARKMFGGFGIYKNGIFFALIINNILYFKVDAANQSDYESFDSKPFTYTNKNDKLVSMSYWEVPIDILENQNKLEQWVEKAVQAAQRAKK
ncbi:TfoX/Sxy family protein [Candidatus Dependentiae bacterium]|jgi:DNA transformation protein|nr:TfoX/Sxy family protein [Candidatus Dependentiae bacterium]